jgi:cytochrome c-type biogenesis protein CcmH
MTCQNQSIYDSDSDYAKDVKKLIKEKFKEGLTEKEIKQFLTNRYGEYILFKPYFNSKNLLLWLFPFILVIGSMFIFIRNLRKT